MLRNIKNLLGLWRHWSLRQWKLVMFYNQLQIYSLGLRGFLFWEGIKLYLNFSLDCADFHFKIWPMFLNTVFAHPTTFIYMSLPFWLFGEFSYRIITWITVSKACCTWCKPESFCCWLCCGTEVTCLQEQFYPYFFHAITDWLWTSLILFEWHVLFMLFCKDAMILKAF